MNLVIQQIESVLKTSYPSGFGKVFSGYSKNGNLRIEDFKKQVDLDLPETFYEFYDWLLNASFEESDVSDQTKFTDGDTEHFIFSLSQILRFTQDWQDIQRDDPTREWKLGFVSIGSWNSCYELVIDTKGEAGEAGCLLYWDFKGGSDYVIKYKNFEKFLETKLELLKEKIYFPPNMNEDEERFEDFMDGEVRERIEEIQRSVNGDRKYISFE